MRKKRDRGKRDRGAPGDGGGERERVCVADIKTDKERQTDRRR